MTNLLLEFTKNSICQAFSALTDYDGLEAPKSKLRVFVASLGTILDCQNVDKGLDDFRASSTLNFGQFEYYLNREVFTSLSDSTTRLELAPLEKAIDEACWNITKSKLEKCKKDAVIQEENRFKLFRIFSLLADLIQDEDGNAQVLISPEEADLVFTKFLSTLNKEWELKEEFECLYSNAIFDFQTFLSIIEVKFTQHFKQEEIKEVINDIYDEFVDDTIKKGALLKRGEYLPKFVEKLFILRSSGLTYYTNPKKEKVIHFDAQTRVEEGHDTNANPKFHQFFITTSNRVLHLATMDKRYRAQWISAIKLALSRLHCRESYGRYLRNKRRLEWHRLKIKRQYEADRAKAQLQAEKMARKAAEDHAKALAEQKAEEEAQRRHLDDVRCQLEKLLAEEIQAKRDEELVRSLQARILNEEWAKREELEKLQQEQRKLLDMERNKTRTFEKKQTEMERQLEEAQSKLRELERSRQEMDSELKTAKEKNQERNREILDTRLKLFSAPIVEDERVHHYTRRSLSMREGKGAYSRLGSSILRPMSPGSNYSNLEAIPMDNHS